ncbi:replication stress response regulator SDE2 [Hyposmocoma kahamanoa]|uniref:replication stress response regulator SDE2 n=1 Tax=Hyposmocoma kahamanoa TaxID=1477025 RepID=UPI000E6D5E29|nr:replication stress response regulator SDE2 [Hyposmocoma kahamanoa]
MPHQVYFEGRYIPEVYCENVSSLKEKISQQHGVSAEDLYVTINGRVVSTDLQLENHENIIRVFTKLVGGKGGFGSMLRAIGAQIEKTTNREACRDLSGRRLRDINEEKRLRKWLEGQEDREREAAERKQKKLERILAEPKIDVKLNPAYVKESEEIPERVSAAVDAGWQAAGTSNESLKRKAEVEKPKAKKKKLWIDADLSDCSSLSDDEDDEPEKPRRGHATSTDSGNESDHASEASSKV